MLRARLHLAVLLVSIGIGMPSVLVAQDAASARNTLAIADLLDMESVGDPQISPDGSQVVYTRRWVDKIEDRTAAALWIMDADGSRNRFLVEGSNPRWSPDGTRILYLAEGEPQGSQIFVRWMDAEGATSQSRGSPRTRRIRAGHRTAGRSPS